MNCAVLKTANQIRRLCVDWGDTPWSAPGDVKPLLAIRLDVPAAVITTGTTAPVIGRKGRAIKGMRVRPAAGAPYGLRRTRLEQEAGGGTVSEAGGVKLLVDRGLLEPAGTAWIVAGASSDLQ